MKCTKETIKKALRTFIQTGVGYFAVNLALVDFSAEKSVLKTTLAGVAVCAVSSGISAVMNLEKKGECG